MALHPELLADAKRVLDDAGCPHEQVVDVEADCILYVNSLGRARTLWIQRQEGSGRLRTRMAEGFQIDPPEDWPGDVPH